MRKEIWLERDEESLASEANFKSVQLARNTNWWNISRNQSRVAKEDRAILVDTTLTSTEEKYLEKWQQGEMFFYSSYAENINLLTDITMLTGFFQQHNIDYLIYRSSPVEQFEPAHLLDFFKQHLSKDPGIIDLYNFSFTGWAIDQGYQPLDSHDRPEMGHPNLEAHANFGNMLIQKLREVYPQWA
jgi:hypothetical protein